MGWGIDGMNWGKTGVNCLPPLSPAPGGGLRGGYAIQPLKIANHDEAGWLRQQQGADLYKKRPT